MRGAEILEIMSLQSLEVGPRHQYFRSHLEQFQSAFKVGLEGTGGKANRITDWGSQSSVSWQFQVSP